ncbi:MAG: hypothetical protein LBU85_11290 [Treponema sp.]|jgi:hypothetical protein|nr:hypothetical protein [Treponema sp.]
MKRVFSLLSIFVIAIPAFAEFNVTVEGTAPTGEASINSSLESAFNDFLTKLNKQIKDVFPNSPDKLLRAMGNSSVYASHGATTRGYNGYKTFSATFGSMIGFQLPQDIFSFIQDGFDMSVLEKEGDINLGISPNMINFNAGLSLGAFKAIPEKLGILKRDSIYFGLRVGYFNLPANLIEYFSYSNLTLGLTLNYQIVPSVNLAGLVTWRGVNLGSGFIYNGSKVSIIMPMGSTVEANIEDASNNTIGTIKIDPKISNDLNTNTYTIPLEATTAIKLVIFNIPFGIGADLTFGKTSLGLGVASPIKTDFNNPSTQTTTDGSISIKAEASNSPSVFNFKIMTGFGIAAGPVIIDIPLTFYPIDKGYSVGVTIGAAF